MTIQNMYKYQHFLQIVTPTFRILVFRDVSLVGRFDLQNLQTSETWTLWTTQISQLLLFLFKAIRRKGRVRVYIRRM